MTRKRKNNKLLTAFLIVLLLVTSVVGGWCSLPAFADTSSYTGVLEDLQKDSTFNINDYPRNSSDTSIQVIQIAESTSGELFVYTYQPAADNLKLTASSINISTAINENLKYQNYGLTQIDTSGVFAKYKVENFTIKKDKMRYYDISSIFRPWNSDIDGKASNPNIIDYVSCAVAQQWTACTVNGSVSYSCTTTETIEVTDKYFGYLRYFNGFKLHQFSCDSWYVAFSTDRQIDKLFEADVSYISRAYEKTFFFGALVDEKYENPIKNSISLTYMDIAATDKVGIWGNSYSWDRIEKVSDFVINEDLSTSAKANLTNKQWVLRFTETDFREESVSYYWDYGTEITEVTILRLKFETDGVAYNLGVVDNKQSLAPNQKPDNDKSDDKSDMGFWEYIWYCIVGLFEGTATLSEQVVAVICLAIAASLFLPLVLSIFVPALRQVLLTILKSIGKVLMLLLHGLLWFIQSIVLGVVFIVTLPFRGIAALIHKIRGE